MSGFAKSFSDRGFGATAQGFGAGFTKTAGVIRTGLVLHYDFGNTRSYVGSSTSVADLVGNSDSTLSNSPSYTSGYLTFNGSNQYLMTNTSMTSKVTTDLTTISMWAYPSDNGVLLSERGEASLASGWHESQMEMVAGTMKFGMWNGAGITSVTSTVMTPLNAWYNFVIRYDGTKMDAYVNGQSAGSVTFSRLNPAEGGTGLFYAIAGPDSTNMGDGTYANMRLGQFLVYDRALELDEIVKNYNATRHTYSI